MSAQTNTEQELYPAGQDLQKLIKKRHIGGTIWRILFLLSTIIAIVVLAVLLLNIINQTFGVDGCAVRHTRRYPGAALFLRADTELEKRRSG